MSEKLYEVRAVDENGKIFRKYFKSLYEGERLMTQATKMIGLNVNAEAQKTIAECHQEQMGDLDLHWGLEDCVGIWHDFELVPVSTRRIDPAKIDQDNLRKEVLDFVQSCGRDKLEQIYLRFIEELR